MIQRRSHRTAPRARSLALGGALAALAVVGGGTVVAVNAPADVDAGDIRLAQNATEQGATEQGAAQEMPLGEAVNLDLEPVVARAAGGTIPAGTTVQVTGLPDGLTQDGWVISGTPTRVGEYEVLVTVSNSGVSESQKVALTVTDGETSTEATAAGDTETGTETATAGDAEDDAEAGTEGASTTDAPDATDAAPTTTPGTDGVDADESGATTSGDETATSPSTTVEGETDPTLSAVPGDPTQAGSSDEGAGDGVETGDGESTSPDMCAVLGDGELDGASLAQMLPMVTGDDESASSGMVAVILNAVVSLLPSVLGDSGSIGELGSAGEFLCTLSPSLLGGGTGEGQADEVETGGADATTGGATADGTTTGDTTTGDTTADGTTTGTAGLDGVPSALLGMLAGGAGSTGQ